MREFFEWWFAQLKALLPDTLKLRLREELCLLYLDVMQDRAEVHARYRGHAHRFGSVALSEPADDRLGLQAFVRDLPRQPDRILLRLAAGRYLSREVELPLAAEENLAESVGFQLEQLTPFNADQALYFTGIRERQVAQKKLLAWLAVTPREQVDKALRILGDPPPTLLRTPPAPPSAGGHLEIVYRPFGQSDGGSFRASLVLSVMLVLVLGAAFSLHLINRIETRDQLHQALATVRIAAGEASDLREQIQHLQDQAAQITGLQLEHASLIPLWDDLTQRLDDGTWLQRIDLRDDKLTLQGMSDNATQLIEQLEASPFLVNVRFGSSVTRDRATDKERFNVSAQVRQPAEGET